MPRRTKILPIALLALVMQVLAPVVVCWIVASMASDPILSAEVCHDSGSSAPSNPSGDRPAHTGDCAICCLTHAGSPLYTPKPTAAIAFNRPSVQVIWPKLARDGTRSRTGTNAQARAPPQLT